MAAGASRPTLPPPRVAVAASGGLDSTALLHCVLAAARPLGVEVHALHVDHGLNPQSNRWRQQLARQCRRWGGPAAGLHFHACRLATRPAAGDSVEAWARRERYRALAEMARAAGCTLVLLAHHQRDQAETVLLQALRGGGPAGLAAMPRHAERQGLCWARPWLEMPRTAIEAYVRRWRLACVDDPGNAERRYARNRLRHDVWPSLTGAFAHAEPALAAAAARAHEAREVLHEVAVADATRAVVDGALQRAAWLELTPARRANLLRHWAARALADPVPESLLQRLLAELPAARGAARWPAGRQELRLHAGALWAVDPAPASWDRCQPIDLSRPGRHELPGPGGVWRVSATRGAGVPAALLARAELRPRRGGEQFQATAHGVARSLKKQFQARGQPAWQRQAPLLWADGRLVFVPGLGVDARCLAEGGGPRLLIEWGAGPRHADG